MLRRFAALFVIIGALLATGCITLPDGLHVHESTNGCTSDGRCPWGGAPGDGRNFYDAPLREIVVAPGQSLKVWAHEACHAHQHQQILDELGHEPFVGPAGFADLREWYSTEEASVYREIVKVDGHPPADWKLSSRTLLEDFAEACGRYLVGMEIPTGRFTFFENRGFK